MTDLPFAAAADADTAASFPLKVLRLLFFTGFALVAVVLGFVFLPVAGVALALLVAWKGFDGLVWSHRDFALRVLSMIAFTAFALVATVLAFVFLPLAGVVLAALFVWRGFGARGPVGWPEDAAPAGSARAAPAATGNAAFDAYRDQTLQRLEQERTAFETFLSRLRAARDQQEFDGFLENRIRRARAEGEPDPGAA